MAFRQFCKQDALIVPAVLFAALPTALVKQTNLQYAKCIGAPENDVAIFKKLAVFSAMV
jgi:hypothetical protein